MKQLGCRELGSDCSFVATGKTDDEIKNKLFKHAEKDHPEMMKTMTPEKRKDLTARMDEALRKMKPVAAGR